MGQRVKNLFVIAAAALTAIAAGSAATMIDRWIMFTRYPESGRAETRWCSPLARPVAPLCIAALSNTLATLQVIGGPLELWVTGADEAYSV